ncbi:hypothetical protein [Streptomyces ortus]|uniref:Uncharacterized protein n=1 Tax=Streptomyces ortus TaxID=2867268 RepID=A0ABT3VCE4_9ACTN|nr:hypothetical protein [Streptomyces ortus]MCX4237612.1 hypothetical protein [Streptomyces ortus]
MFQSAREVGPRGRPARSARAAGPKAELPPELAEFAEAWGYPAD